VSETHEDPRVLTGEIWDELVDRIAAMRDLVWGGDLPDDAVTRAEGARYLLRFLAAGITVCLQLDDTENPELGTNVENRMSWGLDNPDCNYSYCRLRPGATYRISGTLGSACAIEFQLTSGHHADGEFASWTAISQLQRSDLIVADDGTFELILSSEPPGGQGEGNWMRSDERTSFLLVREFFADWEREDPAVLLIERVGGGTPPAPLSTGRVGEHFDLLMTWLDAGLRCWSDFAAGILADQPGDIQPLFPPTRAGGLTGQAYGMGTFRCAPESAVILELEPPDCSVWAIALCDQFFQSIDFDHRQSSLNSVQSTLVDGKFLAVISHDDPGVANWLDPGGNREGIIAVRYLMADSVPPVRYRTVERRELDQSLPRDVARIGPEERRESLQRRRLALQRRYRR
jgi:hypothetical protein